MKRSHDESFGLHPSETAIGTGFGRTVHVLRCGGREVVRLLADFTLPGAAIYRWTHGGGWNCYGLTTGDAAGPVDALRRSTVGWRWRDSDWRAAVRVVGTERAVTYYEAVPACVAATLKLEGDAILDAFVKGAKGEAPSR